MGFGGPVWHASTSHPIRSVRRKAALKALDGVGEKALGEWHDDRPTVYHVRRRLTPAEASFIGPVVDVRGTSEVDKRAERILAAHEDSPMRAVIERYIREELAQ